MIELFWAWYVIFNDLDIEDIPPMIRGTCEKIVRELKERF